MLDMSSATIHPMPELDPTDRQINRTVRALLAIREMTPPTFMARAGITKGTYYNRLRGDGGGWTAAEVKRAADALGVSVATLYDGLLPAAGVVTPSEVPSGSTYTPRYPTGDGLAKVYRFPEPRRVDVSRSAGISFR